MSIVSKIIGGRNSNQMNVTDDKQASVIDASYPAPLSKKFTIPFRDYFKDADGDSSMLSLGTLSTPLDFTINAEDEIDIYVNSINIIIADAGAVLNKFGAITALTNGCQLIWSTTDYGDVYIHDAIKTNLDFMRLAGGNPSVGTGSDAFLADLSGGGADAYLPHIDFSDMFGLKWGMPLRAGSNDKLIFRVRDNVSGIDQFDAIAYGMKI